MAVILGISSRITGNYIAVGSDANPISWASADSLFDAVHLLATPSHLIDGFGPRGSVLRLSLALKCCSRVYVSDWEPVSPFKDYLVSASRWHGVQNYR